MTKIIRNSAICLSCATEIVSLHRHDFQWCPCGSIFVDGGTDYLKRGGDPALFDDTSITDEDAEAGVIERGRILTTQAVLDQLGPQFLRELNGTPDAEIVITDKKEHDR